MPLLLAVAKRWGDLSNNGGPRAPETLYLETALSIGSRRLIAPIISWCFLATVSLLLLPNALNRDYNHDEETYIFSAVLAGDFLLYSDFMYLQPPVYPMIQSLLFTPFDQGYFILARVTSWLFAIGSTFLLFRLSQAITGNLAAATALAAMFAFSTLVLAAAGSARNDIMPVFFTLLGFWWYWHGEERRTKFPRSACFLAGVCFALAVGVKALYAFVPVVVVMRHLAYWAIQRNSRLAADLGALILGGVVGSIPLTYFAVVSWDQFVFNVFTFHMIWQELTSGQPAPYSKAFAALSFLNRDVIIANSILATGLAILGCKLEGYRALGSKWVVLFASLVVVGLPFCMLPDPLHPQYLVPLVPLLLLLSAALYAMVPKTEKTSAHMLLAAVAIVGTASGVLLALDEAVETVWGRPLVERIHKVGEGIRAKVELAGLDGKVATLSPIHAIDSGLRVYKEFSTGPFFFRMADNLEEDEIERFRGVSPGTLERFLDHDPPAAVLTGLEPMWDRSLEEYAKRRGYRKADGDFDGLALYLKADG